MIKDEKGDPVRALKSNRMGQFALTTPLSRGKYTITVSSKSDSGLSFDIIPIEIKGELVPPVELVGK